MEAALYQTILSQGACVDLSTRAKWRLSGPDRVRYLNGQVTQDVRSATSDKALHACVTNVKGRIEGDIFIHADADSLLFDAPADLRESLGARLERYIIADDALLEDVTDSWQLWHCIEVAPGTTGGSENGLVRLKNNRLGLEGYDLWLPLGSPAPGVDVPTAYFRRCRNPTHPPRCPRLAPGTEHRSFSSRSRPGKNSHELHQRLLHRPGNPLAHQDHRQNAERSGHVGSRRG